MRKALTEESKASFNLRRKVEKLDAVCNHVGKLKPIHSRL